MTKERILSGMQSSGKLHLGNLVGALSNWVRLQDSYDCYYFIADWHSLTTGYSDTSAIKESTRDILVNFLAAGLDPEKCTIFIESRIPEHAELHLLLSMITPLGWLERVPTYKEKQQELKDRDLSTYGFLGYPLLMTADIIIYRAKYVPVGIDQVPHLEISPEITRRFNSLYKEIFPQKFLGMVLACFTALLLIYGYMQAKLPAAKEAVPGLGNTEMIARSLFTDYLLPFEVTSVLLLVTIVGAVVLSKSKLK